QKMQLEKELELRKQELEANIQKARDKGAFVNPGFGRPEELDASIAGEKLTEKITGAPEKIEEIEDAIRRAENRAEALGDKLEDATSYHEALEDEKALLAEEQ